MNIYVSKEVKVRIVQYGEFRIFGSDKRTFSTDEEFIRRFDEVWQSGLRTSLEEAIRDERTVEPHVVRNRIVKQYKKSENMVKLVSEHKPLYEFTYKVLCVAQLEPQAGSSDFTLERLWGFTYSDAPPELLCFHFNSPEEKRRFEELATGMGEQPRQLAKAIVLERMKNISQQQELLEKHRKTLAYSVLQLAQFGLHAPAHVALQIQESRDNISRIKQVLREWGVRVEDLPDDAA